MIDALYDIIEKVREEFAPDPRLAVFEVELFGEDDTLVLLGAISVPAAAEALQERIATLDLGQPLRYRILRIPEPAGERPPHGIITAATAPMLAGPLVSHSHLSQVLLGSRVLVLREHGRWLQCRSADGYIGWVHRGYVRRVDEREARAWELGADGSPHLSLGAEVLGEDGRVLAKLPWGARFAVREELAILPDGRSGTLRGDAVAVQHARERFPTEGPALLETLRSWRGSPYLWGGTTPWGVDCSGLVQATFRMHGIDLPRDSDQQAALGAEVDEDLDRLRPGDLLFFAEWKDRISHVVISTGGSGIIHSALGNGGVQENDLTGTRGYERELRSLLVTVRRLPELGDGNRPIHIGLG